MQRIRLAPDHEISRVIRGGWQMAGGHGAVDSRDGGRGHGGLRRRRDHHLRLRRHLHRRRGADRRLPRALPRARGRGGAGADQGAHEVRAGPRPAAAADRAPTWRRSIDRSLRRLGAERLDLVQFHWWDYGVPRLARGGAAGSTSCGGRARSAMSAAPTSTAEHLAAIVDAGRAAGLDAGAVFAARPPAGEGDARGRRGARGGAALLRDRRRRVSRRPLARAARAGGSRSRTARSSSTSSSSTTSAAGTCSRRCSRRCAGSPTGTAATSRRWRARRCWRGRGGGGDRRGAQPRAPRGEPRDRGPRARRGRPGGDRRRCSPEARPLEGDVYTLERDRSGRHGAIMKYNLNEGAA